jgi:hypothetical protein
MEQNLLPPGWQAVQDPQTGRTYYQNTVTQTTQWEPPFAGPSPVSDGRSAELATINRILANKDGATATSSAGNMGDIDNDLRCHLLQYDISLEGVQNLRNAGVCRLSDFHYIQSSDVRNMNMSLIDQRKTDKMLESWHAMHQDGLR